MAGKGLAEVLRICRNFSCLRLQSYTPSSALASHLALADQCKSTPARHFSLHSCTYSKKKVKTHQHEKRNPVNFNYSGDLVSQPALSPDMPHYSVKESSAYQSAPEEVKKLFTLGFVTGNDKKTHRMEEMVDRIHYLFGPNCDKELRVAKMTVTIRNMMPHCLTFQKEKRGKVRLVEMIQARKKVLKQLRLEDYERFFWLLRELRIKYVPYPAYPRYIGKRKRTRMAAVQEMLDTRRDKLLALRKQLEAEREEFEVEKARILAEIDADIAEFGLDKEELFEVLERKPVQKEEPVIPVRSHLVKGSEELQQLLQQEQEQRQQQS